MTSEKKKRLIFVCTGNTCRSPMAEGLLRALLGEKPGWDVASAGVYASLGQPASPHAIAALREKDIDISTHQSQPLTLERIQQADLLITMTQSHRDAVLSIAPESRQKVFLLKSFGIAQCAADITDPFGESFDVYCQIRDEIEASLSDLILGMMEQKQAAE